MKTRYFILAISTFALLLTLPTFVFAQTQLDDCAIRDQICTTPTPLTDPSPSDSPSPQDDPSPSTDPSPSPTNPPSSNNSSSDSSTNSGGSSSTTENKTSTGQVLGASTLAPTGNYRSIALFFMIGIILAASSGYAVKKYLS